MTTFNESQHSRDQGGRFAAHIGAEQEGSLTQLRIENTYADGDEVVNHVALPTPNGSDLDEWFEDEVFEHTGTGRDDGTEAIYEATIVESSRPELIGKSYGWQG